MLQLFAFGHPAFTFRLPVRALLLPLVLFFDELSPIGMQPIPGMLERKLFASHLRLLLLEVGHSPRKIFNIGQDFGRVVLDVLTLLRQLRDRLISFQSHDLKLLLIRVDLLPIREQLPDLLRQVLLALFRGLSRLLGHRLVLP